MKEMNQLKKQNNLYEENLKNDISAEFEIKI